MRITNENTFSTETLVVRICHSLLCFGIGVTDDSELHITKSSVSYRHVLLAPLLDQMSVLQSTALSLATSNLDSDLFPHYP